LENTVHEFHEFSRINQELGIESRATENTEATEKLTTENQELGIESRATENTEATEKLTTENHEKTCPQI